MKSYAILYPTFSLLGTMLIGKLLRDRAYDDPFRSLYDRI